MPRWNAMATGRVPAPPGSRSIVASGVLALSFAHRRDVIWGGGPMGNVPWKPDGRRVFACPERREIACKAALARWKKKHSTP